MVSLPKAVLACLVGLVADRLVELAVQGSPCVLAAVGSLPRGLDIHRWQRKMGSPVGSCHRADIDGEEGPLT